MMKVAAILSLFAVSVNGFTPSTTQRAPVSSLRATAELEGLVGVDIESGKKIVRRCKCISDAIFFGCYLMYTFFTLSLSQLRSLTPLD
jgi:hypothetical protein